jgi:Ulp1 family protease
VNHYPCFQFLGPSPIDYDHKINVNECVWNELCNYKLQHSIKNNKKKVGIVFNLDTHEKGGSHWVSMFIHIPKRYIFYFDSAGEKIPDRLKTFVDKVQQHGNELNTPFEFDQNHPFQHQFTTTECGIYSLYFIANMLEDKLSREYLKTKRLPDNLMKKYRKIYFNSPEYIST